MSLSLFLYYIILLVALVAWCVFAWLSHRQEAREEEIRKRSRRPPDAG